MAVEQVFNNYYLVGLIFNQLRSSKLLYINLNRTVNQYLFDNLLVEFSITRYLIWLIKSKTYEPISFARLLYWDAIPIYIPSCLMDDLDQILGFLRIQNFKRIRIQMIDLIYHHYRQSVMELTNRLNLFILTEQRLAYYIDPTSIEELIINYPNLTMDLNPYQRLQYLNSGHTRVNNIPVDQLYTLVIDVKNLPRYQVFPRLKHLKLLDLQNYGFNYKRYFQTLDWTENFPQLNLLYLDINPLPDIDLTHVKSLRTVYTYDPIAIKLPPEAKINLNFEQIRPVFERPIGDKQTLQQLSDQSGEFNSSQSTR